jgi:predicted RecA/RadA family phage recombinase
MRSDGKAVEVTLLEATTKDSLVLVDGFIGFAMQDGSSGDVIALEIAQREFEITVDGAITAAKGDILYMDSSGDISNTASGNTPFMKVTSAKDANNVVWGILLPQLEANA